MNNKLLAAELEHTTRREPEHRTVSGFQLVSQKFHIVTQPAAVAFLLYGTKTITGESSYLHSKENFIK